MERVQERQPPPSTSQRTSAVHGRYFGFAVKQGDTRVLSIRSARDDSFLKHRLAAIFRRTFPLGSAEFNNKITAKEHTIY